MKRIILSIITILGPALFCACSQAQTESVFEYKEIYLPNAKKQQNLNNIDTDWGIWGHNLSQVLPKNPSQEIYAQLPKGRDKSQFCFSSPKLYKYIEDYIEDNFGEDNPQRFAILPNDNPLVCQCMQCTAHGNTAHDASPTVLGLIERLAKRFPKHLFFTSYYQTTKSIPDRTLPDNTGVLVSAMSYPLSSKVTPQEEEFKTLLNTWSKRVKHVYVWDYINNFDDYFTPFPVFEVMQHRLRLYHQMGVSGIFLNGSGEDYSLFSDIKLHVLSHLLDNPDQDWKPLVKDYCQDSYPVTGNVIADFIIRQESWTKQAGKSLPLYEGVSQAVNKYLPVQDFIAFHDSLQDMLPHTAKQEKNNVSRMYKAMMLPRLEFNRILGDTTACSYMLQQLASLNHEGVHVYSESCWSLDNYVNDYTYICNHAEALQGKNHLKGKQLIPLTPLDEEYNSLTTITDGLLGLPSNYHCGQLIFSTSPVLKIGIPHIIGAKTLRISFIRNVSFRIAFPVRVTLRAGKRTLAATPVIDKNCPNRAFVDFNIPSGAYKSLILNIMRNVDVHSMAIDEIEAI